jgi:hypothetical protein
MNKIDWPLVRAYFFVAAIIACMFYTLPARAHDMENPELDKWYESLKQPDNPTISCCGVADAYWCGNPYTRNGKNYCKLEDDRVVPNRTPHPVGMEIEIPDRKMMDGHKTLGNPTGHNVIFLTSGSLPSVYCFILDSGI